MRRKIISIILVLYFVVLLAGCATSQQKAVSNTASPSVEITVSAAASMKDVISEVQKNYEVKNPHVKLVLNWGGSGSLQRQIEYGAPVDVFISAAPKHLDYLAAKNMINQATRIKVAENTLVLVVPVQSSLKINRFEDLLRQDVEKIGLGEPASVPAGQYGKQVLEKLGIWDDIKGKLVYGKDVRSILTYVETGNVDAGIVYSTDALLSDKVKVVAMVPYGAHDPIVYSAAVIAGTKQEKAAKDFLAFLQSDESRPVFERYGFVMRKGLRER